MNDVTFSPEGWSGYLYWQMEDRKTLKKINQLIQSVQRDGASAGIGKPKQLRHEACWSRRIDDKNRLLYEVMDGNIYITACRGHYNDT